MSYVVTGILATRFSRLACFAPAARPTAVDLTEDRAQPGSLWVPERRGSRFVPDRRQPKWVASRRA